MASSSSTPGSATEGPAGYLAWRWVAAALFVFALATFVAWYQPPRPVPPNRAEQAWSFWHPLETSPHRRLLTIGEDLRAVHFLPDGLSGWAVGERGRILATRDGGNTWAIQPSGTGKILDAVTFQPDGRLGWAGDKQGAMLATTDGGRHWQDVAQPWEKLVQEGYLTTLPRITGRLNWIFQYGLGSPSAKERYPLQLDVSNHVDFFIDKKNGWRIHGLFGDLNHTLDGGKTWLKQDSGVGSRLLAVHMHASGKAGWAVGRGGAIVGTRDSGKTWHPQTATSQLQFTDLWLAPDGRNAWAVGYDGLIAASADGGQTWRRQASGVTAILLAVTFLDDTSHGWAAGSNGTIILTNDGGKTWIAQAPAPLGPIYGLSFSPNGQRGWAVDATGKQLITTDGGVTWSPDTNAVPRVLHSIGFSPDRRFGWAIDLPPGRLPALRGGRLVTSTDGGQRWTDDRRRSGKNLLSASFDASGQRGSAVLDEWLSIDAAIPYATGHGKLATTVDGGLTWQWTASRLGRGMNAVKLLNDGRHGIAAGIGGVILATDDGGRHWRFAERYSRSPAPWYWLAVTLAASLAWAAWYLRPAGQARVSVADVAASDAEVRVPADDRLQFSGLARGISRFLRNVETKPPLTLAITGDWGSGKSSLMQLVCADLRRFHHRPIWFNAWHHQREEHLFAALLGAIHAQAAPPIFSLSGLGFRLRLLWSRSRRHFGVVLVTVMTVAGLAIFSWRALESGGVREITASVSTMHERIVQSLAALSGLAAAFTALWAVVKGSEAFALNPAVLLGTAREHMSLKAAAAQNDFRNQFANQFEEITNALSYRLVLVVDDLDRCRPAAVIDVMEAVNYLTSAGKCIVLFGMASERVIAALGLAFKDIAAELVQMEHTTGTHGADTATDSALELAKRRAYATEYLQKLVNIEVKVPSPIDRAHHRLLQSVPATPNHTLFRYLMGALSLWPLGAVIAAVLLGVAFADWAEYLFDTEADGRGTIAQAPPGSQPPVPADTSPRPPPPPPPPSRSPFEYQPGDAPGVAAYLGWGALAVLPLFATAAMVAFMVLRQSLYSTRDSADFQSALEIWTPVVASQRATPRSIKRFGNRLRYLAMLQQGEENDLTVLDVLREKIRRLRRPLAPSTQAPSGPGALSEQHLIALGTMYEVFGDNWKEKMNAIFPLGWRYAVAESTGAVTAANRILAAAVAHQDKFDTEWPPSEAEIAIFERLIAGVRLAGDA